MLTIAQVKTKITPKLNGTTIVQFLTGATATVWLWDVLNGFVVFIALTMSSVLYESDKNNHI